MRALHAVERLRKLLKCISSGIECGRNQKLESICGNTLVVEEAYNE